MKLSGKAAPNLVPASGDNFGQNFRNLTQNLVGPSLHVNYNLSHHLIECLKSILHYVRTSLMPATQNLKSGKNFKNLPDDEVYTKGKDIKSTIKNLQDMLNLRKMLAEIQILGKMLIWKISIFKGDDKGIPSEPVMMQANGIKSVDQMWREVDDVLDDRLWSDAQNL
jgi:hypothetical protein